MVPLSDSTIYQMENKGEFPRRFALTKRCVVWDYDDIVKWLNDRKTAQEQSDRQNIPDVRKRKQRPVSAAA